MKQAASQSRTKTSSKSFIDILRDRRKQRGVSMIDIGIWAALAVGVVVIFVKATGPVLAQNRARDEIAEMARVVTNVQAKWSNSPNFNGVTLAQLISNDVFPRGWINGATVNNRWGGAVTVATSTMSTANDSLILTSEVIPSEECKNIIPGLSEVVRVVTVGATVVKPNGGIVDMAALGTACGSGTTVSVSYQIGKS